MSKLEIPRQIRTEDFPAEYSGLINKLSMLLTPFMTSVYTVLDGRVDYVNLNRQLVTVRVATDASGNIISLPVIKKDAKIGRVAGVNVVAVNNLTNPGTFVTSAPFAQGSNTETTYTVLNITGLSPNTEYNFTFELIGN